MDLEDILYWAPNFPGYDVTPTNSRPDLHDGALLCVTDLVDCCGETRTVRGSWYYPGGHMVPNRSTAGPRFTFLTNRGPNEFINGRQFFGSVRLFRRWSRPPERGRFRCELPNAANPSINQTVYVNIGKY